MLDRSGWKHRLLLGVLATATLIAVTAVPGSAAKPAKIYTLGVTPAQAVAGQSTDFFVTVTNVTPGNSNANSFSVTAPTGFTVTGASISAATNANANATVTQVGSTVNVQSLDPMKTGHFVTLKVTATTPSIAPDCTTGGYTWSATVWTGSGLSGDTFALHNPGAAQVTTLVSCLELRFVKAPSNGTINTDMDVQAAVYVGSGPSAPVYSSFTGSVTIALVTGPSGAALSGNGPTAAVAGVASFPTFQGDTTGDYVVKATSAGVQDSPAATFTLYAGVLDCGEATTIGAVGAQVTLTRLEGTVDGTNPDGSTCEKIPYTLTRGENVVEFLKDLDLQPTAEFTIDVNAWDPEPAVNPVPPTQVEPPAPADDVQWCGGTAVPFAPILPPGESWCLVSQSTVIAGSGGETQLMQVTETFYGKGDPRIFR